MLRWIVVAVVFASCIARADMTLTGVGGNMASTAAVTCSTYVGPGDALTSAKAWFGLRSFSSAQCLANQKLIKIRNTSTAELCDVLPSSTGGIGNLTGCTGSGSGSAATYCTSNTCAVTTAYDQSGANQCSSAPCDASTTTASQPTLIISCLNSLPCLQPTASSGLATTTLTTLGVSAFTHSTVWERTGHFANFNTVIGCGGTLDGTSIDVQSGANTANNALAFAGNFNNQSGVNDNVEHAVQFVYNGASSVIYFDGSTSATFNAGANTCDDQTRHAWFASGGNLFVGDIMEGGIWAFAFNSTQAGNICNNQRTYWGFAGSC